VTGISTGATRQARHGRKPQQSPLEGAAGHLTGPALRLLTGASVYREPAGRNALLFQVGQECTAAAPEPAAQGPATPYHAPADLAELVAECEDAGVLVVPEIPRGKVPAQGDIPPVFVDRRTAGTLHRDLLAAGLGDEITSAHRRAAEYWQWRAAAWPQDRYADLHDLLEGRHHLHEAGDNDQAGTLTEVVCAQLHAWGELDHEAALIQETLAWLPARSPLRAAWIQEIGKIAQVRGNHIEAERRYQQSLEISASLGDAAAVSRSQHRLGVLAQVRGDYAEAEQLYQQSLDQAREPADDTAADAGGAAGSEAPGSRPQAIEAGDAQPCEVRLLRAGRGGRPGARRSGRRSRRRTEMLCLTGTALAAAVVLVALPAAGFTRFMSPGSGATSAVPAAASSTSAAAVRQQAAIWIARQLGRSAVVSCDPAMCAALRAQGLPAGNLLMLGPSSEDPLGSDVVVATAAVRNQFRSRLTGVYAPMVAAAFGPGKAAIQIRVVAPYGALAYRNALRADVLARKSAGAQLLRNKEISVTAAARKELTAGQVDSRLLTTLAALAAQRPLAIAGFADSGPGASAGIPLRSAEVAAPGTMRGPAQAGPGNARFLRAALAFLRAQRPPYLAASLLTVRLPGGQDVVRVQFAGPSPLGMLTGGNAGADTSP
jgi:tetratricopeptide (TPR) repeat protein